MAGSADGARGFVKGVFIADDAKSEGEIKEGGVTVKDENCIAVGLGHGQATRSVSLELQVSKCAKAWADEDPDGGME